MLLSRKHNMLLVRTPRAEQLATVIPKVKVSDKDRELLFVPFTLYHCQFLRKLGMRNVLAPIEAGYNWPGRYTPYAHQRETAAFCTLNKRGFVLSGLGCVDSKTEYLTPNGWKKISHYNGGLVGQYADGALEFVYPERYIKEPCSEMIHIKTKYGIDQVLSAEHRMLLFSNDSPGKQEVTTAEEFYARGDKWKRGEKAERSTDKIAFSRAAIKTTYAHSGPGMSLSDAQIRVMVATMADGHFPKGAVGTRVVLRLKKQRKVIRLRKLLAEAAIPYKEREQNCATATGYHIFTYCAPRKEKIYGGDWWQATEDQKRVIAEEVIHWDGSTDGKRRSFSSYHKGDADYIQFVFNSIGQSARVLRQDRHRREKLETEYTVIVRSETNFVLVKGTSSSGTKRTNMSIVEATDGYKYCFSVPSGFLILRRNGCVFVTGNSGKTLSALWAADYLMRVGEVKKALIISPLSTLERVWADGIYFDFPERKATVLHGAAKRRHRLLENKAYDFYIVNHDGFQVIYEAMLKRDDFDLVILDEAAVYRNATTDRWKLLRSYIKARDPKYVWGLTGTPTPNAPTDAWGLATMLGANRGITYTRFRDMTMRKITTFKWVPRANATQLVGELLSPAVRFATEDCIDLPPTVFQTRQADITKKQEAAMKAIMQSYKLLIDNGEANAVNEADTQNKLLQLACGFVYGKSGDGTRIAQRIDPGHRVKVLFEVIEEAAAKVIVFVPFTELVHILKEQLDKHYTCEVVHGSTTKKERDNIFHAFQNEKNPRVLVAYPSVMSHGLTLTAAATIVWYAPFPSNDVTTQANARIVRPSQTRTTNIVHIEGTSLERRLYKRLQNRQALQGLLLDYIKDNQ